MTKENKKIPWFLYPFWLIWRLVVIIIEFTGRVIGAVLGLVLLIAGIIISLTIVGAVVGIPLAIFGFMLMIRAIF
ncbi:MAG: hypothetical protein ABIG43_04370 [Chloroflexota bacterium]